MSLLDSRQEIAQLDKSNVLGSIEALGKQVQHAWEETSRLSFTPSAEICSVVVAGMGGSALGADVVKHLYKDTLSVPFDFVNGYTLPAYVNEHTLVILSSYSGTTEEVLACAEEVKARNAQSMVISAGGRLAEIAKENNYTYYHIDPVHNPCGQPRMALGYSIFGMMGLLSKAGLFSLSEADVAAVLKVIEQGVADNGVDEPQDSNPAKALAYAMLDRKPILVAAEFLSGAAHVASNQHNESAKAFVDYKLVPELNHHLMEGLRFPATNKSYHVFLFINSRLYREENQIRMGVTQKIVEAQEIETMETLLQSPTPLTQVFEMLTMFSLSSFYLAMLQGIDPAPIPYVDRFKEELQKLRGE